MNTTSLLVCICKCNSPPTWPPLSVSYSVFTLHHLTWVAPCLMCDWRCHAVLHQSLNPKQCLQRVKITVVQTEVNLDLLLTIKPLSVCYIVSRKSFHEDSFLETDFFNHIKAIYQRSTFFLSILSLQQPSPIVLALKRELRRQSSSNACVWEETERQTICLYCAHVIYPCTTISCTWPLSKKRAALAVPL